MIEALESLGFALSINRAEQRISIQGLGGQIPKSSAQLHVGNAGTAARFLTALLALKEGGVYHLDGDPQMRARPMQGILETLEQLDAAQFKFKGTPYHFPFTMKTHGIQKIPLRSMHEPVAKFYPHYCSPSPHRANASPSNAPMCDLPTYG